jgi:hypothetical protein
MHSVRSKAGYFYVSSTHIFIYYEMLYAAEVQ